MQKRPSQLPIIVISGASGFIGSHFVKALCEDFYIYALARRSQKASEVPLHENISWIRVDVAIKAHIWKVISRISNNGGADFFIHLAGFYDFQNKSDPEYERTNVKGTENILQAVFSLKLKRFIFASSLATIDFFDPDKVINEDSEPDAIYPYAISKKKGEQLVKKYSSKFPCSTIRLAAIFSDWCEYYPLYSFLTTWISERWDRRILVGEGKTAIPYLHINDAISLFLCVIIQSERLPDFHIINAGPRSSTSQRDLFSVAYQYSYFRIVKPVHIPKWFAAFGIILRNTWGILINKRPFERLWMLKYIDTQLIVDSSHTYSTMDWTPTARYSITRRLMFIIAKMKSNPHEWHYRNRKRLLKTGYESQYLKIYEMMVKLKGNMIQRILAEFMYPSNEKKLAKYQKMEPDARVHCVEYIVRMLENDIKTGDRSQILTYAEHLAEHRYLERFPLEEVKQALTITTDVIVQELQSQPNLNEMKQRINDEVKITLQMVIDEIEDTYARLSSKKNKHQHSCDKLYAENSYIGP